MDVQKLIRTYRIDQESGDLTLTDTDVFDGFPQRLAVMPKLDGGP